MRDEKEETVATKRLSFFFFFCVCLLGVWERYQRLVAKKRRLPEDSEALNN